MPDAPLPPEFPTPDPTYLVVVPGVLCLLAGMALVAVCWPLLRKNPRPPQPWHIALWLTAATGALCVFFLLHRYPLPNVAPGFLLWIWGCSLIGTIRIFFHWPAQSMIWIGPPLLLGLGIAFSLPSVRTTPGTSRRVQCQRNLKEIGLAHHRWADQHGKLPPAVLARAEGLPYSWRIELLPFLDVGNFAGYQFSATWDGPENLPTARTRLFAYTCPSWWNVDVRGSDHADEKQRVFTSYAAMTGPATIHPQPEQSLGFQKITDGMSNTALIVESCAQRIPWTEPRDLQITAPARYPAGHRSGAHILMADGSVRFIYQRMNPQILHGLFTATGGETLPEY